MKDVFENKAGISETISVIIPIYNTEKYLKRCMNSVLHQTYRNLEIILVDDGSTDQSLKICMEYQERDQRIKVISRTNGGLSDARNAGIIQATGRYLMFIDSDDWIHKEMIRRLYDGLIEAEADIAVCRMKYVYEMQDMELEQLLFPEKKRVYSQWELLHKLAKRDASDIVDLVVCMNKLYKKELFDTIRFPVGRLHEDEAVIHQLLFRSEKILWLDDPLYFYFQRNGSIMHQAMTEKRFDKSLAFKERADFFIKENRYISDAVLSYLKNLLFTTRFFEKMCPEKRDRILYYRVHYRCEKKQYYHYLSRKHQWELLYRELRIHTGRILEKLGLKIHS